MGNVCRRPGERGWWLGPEAATCPPAPPSKSDAHSLRLWELPVDSLPGKCLWPEGSALPKLTLPLPASHHPFAKAGKYRSERFSPPDSIHSSSERAILAPNLRMECRATSGMCGKIKLLIILFCRIFVYINNLFKKNVFLHLYVDSSTVHHSQDMETT